MSEITVLVVGWINEVMTCGITQIKREQLQRAENAFLKAVSVVQQLDG